MLSRMFGPRLTSVFASRWKAVWWALSMLVFAYSVVPSREEHPAEKAAKAHVDPWAKDTRAE
jgi:hypothetical protein